MAINFIEPPHEHAKIIDDGLDRFRRVPSDLGIKTFQSARSRKLKTALPQEVYFVDLEDFVQDNFLQTAKRVGVRYLVLDNDETYAAVDLNAGADAEDDKFSNILFGPLVDNFVEGFGFAASMEAVNEKDFEPRILEIPAISFVGIWLHDKYDPSNDQIIPISNKTNNKDSEEFSTITEGDLHKFFRARALARLDFNRSPCPPLDPGFRC